ncbi:acyl-CoA thioesterase [Sporolactobacillus sp. CQH2019]|uniref:acyl-CoA thioesterase n=1 Tax=Sporolactobacillus sp. CQH2019 TaxID=3023512 RepID=UPI00236765B6|nr:acyl-CoA thioesterase [Sporolactobacillus sp. CQH2019]MDD9146948.1 acyl-CoA thioesterase [Sporolactobacillus sp. CQH2019]
MFKTHLTVRLNDCDGMRHVNNAVYYTYFEEGTRGIFRLFTPSLDLNDFQVIVASSHCDYLHQTTYNEKITVYTWIGSIAHSSFNVEHAVSDEEGRWHARGHVTLVHFDYRQEKSGPLSESMKRILLQHQQGPEGVPELRMCQHSL